MGCVTPALTYFQGSNTDGSESDRNLVHRVLSGDVEAFYDLVRPHQRPMFLAAWALVRNEADAIEISQEAILRALKNLVNFRHESRFSTWLIQICINEAKARLRKDRRHLFESLHQTSPYNEDDVIFRDIPDWRAIPSQVFEQLELRRTLREALDDLPEKYRTILILRDVQDLSVSETAAILGLSEANVKTRLCRARSRMRDALAPNFRSFRVSPKNP